MNMLQYEKKIYSAGIRPGTRSVKSKLGVCGFFMSQNDPNPLSVIRTRDSLEKESACR